MLWHIIIEPAPGQVDRLGESLTLEAAESGVSGVASIRSARGFLLEGRIDRAEVERAAAAVLVDPVVETYSIHEVSRSWEGECAYGGAEPAERSAHSTRRWTAARPFGCPPPGLVQGQVDGNGAVVHVLPKPGVTDPEAESALALLRDLGLDIAAARTIRTFRVAGRIDSLPGLIERVLANDAVEQAVVGPLPFEQLGQGREYQFARKLVPLSGLSDAELVRVSQTGQLALGLVEMKAIERHFGERRRDPTDCELETIAQTWSEHCSHKTLRGRIEFEGRTIDNLLKETIFGATRELGCDWLVSVFADNAGVVRFDDAFDVCFKVETHNHPSAIDPYGGANTGLGGVIRDALGTGLGAKPICSTDVFCVAPVDLPPENLPEGVLHPRRVLKGVVAGVRDYGNRVGIPTVNGALAVDAGYLANPLVFCGTVGVLPRGKSFKKALAGDRIIAIGGRTGRDGIHGATFSSAELTAQSDALSGGAVQIGNAITEKMVLDVILAARDQGLIHAITDCGAGGFSSAIGEMGAELGAVVELERAPLKYQGLSYTEIWISEAQERMVLAVPPESWPALEELCHREDVEATDLGEFTDTGRLVLQYCGHVVADLSMDFLHDGRPAVVRAASWKPPAVRAMKLPEGRDFGADLIALLQHGDVCSKEWIIRQYDHEVQGRTVLKPLVGSNDDGPGDAAVVLPVSASTRGLAISCGINPRYGKLDPYAMAACVIDEAIRNCVAVGADPSRVALLDNFCWGNTERPETLGSLVLAAQACHDVALAYRAPFISGKDSLNNEYTHAGQSLAIPPTLLISAIAPVPDVRECVSMDLKEPGNVLLILGFTRAELGGSLWANLNCVADVPPVQPRAVFPPCEGGGPRGTEPPNDPSAGFLPLSVPQVDPALGTKIFAAVHQAIRRGLVRSCHDLSEGGLAVALAEMAIAGGLGVDVALEAVPCEFAAAPDLVLLFSESPSRFLLEVRPESLQILINLLEELPVGRLGVVSSEEAAGRTAASRLIIRGRSGAIVIDCAVTDLKTAWLRPFQTL
jgi:phosphoribosylformylglycinamidine synthase